MRDEDPQALEKFRQYLMLLARVHLGHQNQAKLDASDLVQQTLLEAHRKHDQFQGSSASERAAWLRSLLSCNLADAIRTLRRAKRDPAKERALQFDVDATSMRLQAWLASDHTSPSRKALQRENVLHLSEVLSQIPESQRLAVVLRHSEGWSLKAIAEHMGKTERAVAGLLQRGLEQLRHLLDRNDNSGAE